MGDSDSISILIDELGGSAIVGAALRDAPSTVSSWQARKSIPSNRWVEIVALARIRRVRRVTADRLARLHARIVPAQAGAVITKAMRNIAESRRAPR